MSAEPVSRVPLQDIAACFEGIIPSMLCTCSIDGIPNVTYLSIVHRLDDEHVALSVQFFNKTRRNVMENPRARIVVVDPRTMEDYRLDVGFDRTESEGPVFDLVRTRLEATASQAGMKDVFRLRGVDVYRVLDCQPRLAGPRAKDVREHGDPMEQLSRYASGLIACKDLETLMTVALENLDRIFGHGHSFVMVCDEGGSGLYTLLSHGFDASGVGSEVRIGEGLIGAAAERREPVRSSNLSRDRVFSQAVRQSLNRSGQEQRLQREIPLPGLAGANSQLVVPLVAHDELVGVLCLQSATPGRFLAADERLIQIVGHHVAASMVMLGFTASGATASAVPAVPPRSGRIAPIGSATVKYYRSDDSIFIDDEYLIKGVAGRLLHKLLRLYLDEGRDEFTNKELRVDSSLGLPDYQDNLEARLVLLRKRLEERCAFLGLSRTGRGRLRLDVRRHVRLTVLP